MISPMLASGMKTFSSPIGSSRGRTGGGQAFLVGDAGSGLERHIGGVNGW